MCRSTAGRRLRHFGVCGGNHVFAILALLTQMTFFAAGKNFRARGRLQRKSKMAPKWSWGIAERFSLRRSKSSGQQKGAAEKRQNRENVATLARKELLTKITWGGGRRITLRTLVFPVKFDSYARDGICNMMQDILAGAGIITQ